MRSSDLSYLPTVAVRPATDSEPRLRFLYTASAVAFLLAAAALAVVRSVQPFDHGWWLVSYLALVGEWPSSCSAPAA